MSRLRFLYAIAVVAVLVAASVALAACGGGSGKSGESPQERCSTKRPCRGSKAATSTSRSASRRSGAEGGHLDVSLSGPFQGEGAGSLPQLDMNAKAKGDFNGKNVDFEGGLVLLPNTAFVNYEGTEYEVDPTTFSFVESALEPGPARRRRRNRRRPASPPARKNSASLKVADFLENGNNEGSADVGGTSTTKVSGDLERLRRDRLGARSGRKPGLPRPARRRRPAALEGGNRRRPSSQVDRIAVKTAHVDVYVGDDDIVRRIAAQLKIEPKNGGSGPQERRNRIRPEADRSQRRTDDLRPRRRQAAEQALRSSSASTRSNCSARCRAKKAAKGLGELLEGLAESQTR